MVKFFPLNLIFINLFGTVLCNYIKHEDRVSSDIQTMRSGLKKQGAAEFFFNNFKVFGYLMKHSFMCLM